MRFHALPLALAACATAAAFALAGCGGSDAGAPQSPQAPRPVSSSAQPASVPLVSPATFVVRVGEGANAERFVVKMSEPKAIAIARLSLSGGLERQPVLIGELRQGNGGFNIDPATGRAWSWHLEPSSVSFADLSAELTDGRPSDIEGNLVYWMRLGRYTPWNNHIERELLKVGPKLKSK